MSIYGAHRVAVGTLVQLVWVGGHAASKQLPRSGQYGKMSHHMMVWLMVLVWLHDHMPAPCGTTSCMSRRMVNDDSEWCDGMARVWQVDT